MASYISMGTYDASVRIPEFKGLMQYGDGINTDPRYAVECRNLETPGGVLQPVAAHAVLAPTLPNPIETLAVLHRRWYTGGDEKDILIAASGQKLYAMLPSAAEWTELAYPSELAGYKYKSNVWSFVSYEINPEGSPAPVDVLLLSNAQDGMVMVRGDTMTVSAVSTPKKFGVITRYAERIWGGAIPDDPDMLVYSSPYDPTNWEANTGLPEDGAGDVQQPSWDGDSFTALCPFGSQLIAFTRTRAWRILGTDPGEYTFKEQYGGGASCPATIAVDAERIFMLTERGVAVYDGLSVMPFQQEYAKGIFDRINRDALQQATACLWRGSYYCALPLDGSSVNNAVLIYNTTDGTWLMRDDLQIESFLPTEERLYFTSAVTPGRVSVWQTDCWEAGAATAAQTRWVSPWMDLQRKEIQKGGFNIYVLCEVRDAPVTLSISVQTEKKTKTKQYTVQPVTGSERGQKQKRLHFGGAGRRFRLIIESPSGGPAWRLVSGILVVAEIDTD